MKKLNGGFIKWMGETNLGLPFEFLWFNFLLVDYKKNTCNINLFIYNFGDPYP